MPPGGHSHIIQRQLLPEKSFYFGRRVRRSECPRGGWAIGNQPKVFDLFLPAWSLNLAQDALRALRDFLVGRGGFDGSPSNDQRQLGSDSGMAVRVRQDFALDLGCCRRGYQMRGGCTTQKREDRAGSWALLWNGHVNGDTVPIGSTTPLQQAHSKRMSSY